MRTVIDHMPANIFVKDREGRFLLNNTESMRILGVSKQEELLHAVAKSEQDGREADEEGTQDIADRTI